MRRYRKTGQGIIQVVGILWATMMMGGFGVDAAMYFHNQTGMQNAADAAALAAALDFYKAAPGTSVPGRKDYAIATAKSMSLPNQNKLNSTDVEFGFVDPVLHKYVPLQFNLTVFDLSLGLAISNNYVTTGGLNSVKVTVRSAQGQANNPLQTMFLKMQGIDTLNSAATAVALYESGNITRSKGLHSMYMCEQAWNYVKNNYTDPSVPTVTLYSDVIKVDSAILTPLNSCGLLAAGNWGEIDYDGTGQAQINKYLLNGNPNDISTGDWLGANPGFFLGNKSTAELTNLMNNKTVIRIPLYTQYVGIGPFDKIKVSKTVGFMITNFNTTTLTPWIQGRFVNAICNSQMCTMDTSATGTNIGRVRLATSH